ncbi:hypothetical protein DSO57_1007165 [Entomophthora muscae]|uniref:Uncharacterized protein n=1 Tax=Entomophthora muscae TaxID=34485 RepID=A0ACC2U644_9FUNG|nr:hypothetical protein DSO57_1007165 [Entomophthora muscae]
MNKLMGVRGVLSTSYHPESNGMVERVNVALVSILRKLADTCTTEWFLTFQLVYGHHPAILPFLYSAMGNPEDMTYQQYLTKLADILIKLKAKDFSENSLCGFCPPVPKVSPGSYPGTSWKGLSFSSKGSKWAFIHSQKEDPLRKLLGVKETIWVWQYLESSNNILYSFTWSMAPAP